MNGEQPDTAQSNTVALLDTLPEVDMTDGVEYERSSKARSSESAVSHVESPVSASQMYHAALVDGSTLDDMLAAFEADEDSRGILVDRIFIRRNPRAYFSAERLDALDQGKQQTYRNLSTRYTGGGVAPSMMVRENAPGSLVQASPQPTTQEPKTTSAGLNAIPTETGAVIDENLQQCEVSPEQSCEHGISEVETPERHTNLHTMDRCPTFLRRHQSFLPRRSVSGQKQPLAVLKERGAMSTPQLPSSTPTKQRGKLQRRIRPKESPARD